MPAASCTLDLDEVLFHRIPAHSARAFRGTIAGRPDAAVDSDTTELSSLCLRIEAVLHDAEGRNSCKGVGGWMGGEAEGGRGQR